MNSINAFKQHSVFQDQYGRQKRKLRISVTDRCNFKCVYCMPEHPTWMNKQDLLSFEQLYVFCDLMVQQGIQYIRITGGEPLMRQGVVHFIAQLQALRPKGLKRISMTTNAHYLAEYAFELKQAGLDDLNISLDSLVPKQFQQLTQKSLQPVLDGIDAAKKAGFPIKINTVLLKGKNEDQILPLVQWARQQQVELRFIEFMPLDGDQYWQHTDVVTEADILQQLQQHYQVDVVADQGAHPARQYLVNGQRIGIISTISHSFCGACDRLRLNAQGELFNCLFATSGLNIKEQIGRLMRADDQLQHQKSDIQTDLLNQLKDYIWHKKSGYAEIQHLNALENLSVQVPTHKTHTAHAQKNLRKISMHMIGG